VTFGGMHNDLFTEFGEQGVVTHSDDSTTDVLVVMAFGVDEVDAYNEVVDRVDKASFRRVDVTVKMNEMLTVATGEFAGTYNIGKKLESNGFVEGREIVRSTAS